MLKEIEVKYLSNDINIEKFHAQVVTLPELKSYKTASSYDHYYSNNERFMRWRVGSEFWQLTSKTKTSDTNNIVRTEVNIDLSREPTKDEMDTFSKMHKLDEDFTIYKTARIYFFEKFIIAYYITYDTNMKERERFIEIEAAETYKWIDDNEAKAVVEDIEKQLGLSPMNRLKLSLFERYSKRS